MTARASEAVATRAPAIRLSRASDECRQWNERQDAYRMPGSNLEELRIAELETRVEELDAYACSVSHDLRGPLRAVQGFAAILEEDHGGELTVDARACVARILSGAREMARVIDDLLVLSRIGAQQLAVSLVNSRELVDRTLADLLPQPPGRVRVTVGELRDCTGNAGLLRQVWMNLLSNALKFTRERDPAVIEVGSYETDRLVTYFVRDNGAGFDMNYARDLFLPFRRFHDASRFEGHGMGLAIVRRIIRCHGDRVWAEALPEKGATFYFTVAAA